MLPRRSRAGSDREPARPGFRMSRVNACVLVQGPSLVANPGIAAYAGHTTTRVTQARVRKQRQAVLLPRDGAHPATHHDRAELARIRTPVARPDSVAVRIRGNGIPVPHPGLALIDQRTVIEPHEMTQFVGQRMRTAREIDHGKRTTRRGNLGWRAVHRETATTATLARIINRLLTAMV